MENWQLQQKQSLPLNMKISISKMRIREWYNKYNGDVYVAFSGGKDSTVLLDLVRSTYPNIKAVFVDTGLEYPEIKKFIKTINNVETIRPKISFLQVLDKYGYPIISKTVSMAISRYRNTKDPIQKEYRMYGSKNGIHIGKAGVIPKKYHFLIDAPFKISEQCCTIMKKNPFLKFEKRTGLKPFIGLMANDSNYRKKYYLKNGCNAFDLQHPKSMPLSFWTEKDIWNYIKKYNINYSNVYDIDGIDRTGCMFCMFGINKEKNDRFEIMKKTHPKIYKYCMEKLKIKDILKYIK